MKLYLDYKNKVKFPLLASYKLDGIFCVVIDKRPVSKDGHEFKAMPNLNYADGVEGELYNHDLFFEDIISAVKKQNPNTELIEFYPHEEIKKIEVQDEDQLYNLLNQAIYEGYEGLVLDTNLGKLKLKTKLDSEFTILDIIEGSGKLSGKAGKFIFDGFSAGILGTHDYLERLWNDRSSIIGKKATVEYQNLSKIGIPRFPKVKSIRDYE